MPHLIAPFSQLQNECTNLGTRQDYPFTQEDLATASGCWPISAATLGEALEWFRSQRGGHWEQSQGVALLFYETPDNVPLIIHPRVIRHGKQVGHGKPFDLLLPLEADDIVFLVGAAC